MQTAMSVLREKEGSHGEKVSAVEGDQGARRGARPARDVPGGGGRRGRRPLRCADGGQGPLFRAPRPGGLGPRRAVGGALRRYHMGFALGGVQARVQDRSARRRSACGPAARGQASGRRPVAAPVPDRLHRLTGRDLDQRQGRARPMARGGVPGLRRPRPARYVARAQPRLHPRPSRPGWEDPQPRPARAWVLDARRDGRRRALLRPGLPGRGGRSAPGR